MPTHNTPPPGTPPGTSPRPAPATAKHADAYFHDLATELKRAREQAAQTRLAYQADKTQREQDREQTAQVRQQSHNLRLELAELHFKLSIKQEVITLLLPYYPYPLMPRLQFAINL